MTYNGSGPIPDFFILQLGQVHENFRRWMLYFQQLEDRGTVVGDGHIADLVDQHFVQTHRTQTGFHDV